jgi:hypothetical protein
MARIHLIDLHDERLVRSYDSDNGEPPKEALADAEKRAKRTGHIHVLASERRVFQPEIAFAKDAMRAMRR